MNREAKAAAAAKSGAPQHASPPPRCPSPRVSSSGCGDFCSTKSPTLPGGLPPRPLTAACQLQLADMRASASSEKVGNILRLVEQLERQALEEAAQVAAPQAPQLVARVSAAPAPPLQAAPAAADPIARMLAAQPLSLSSKHQAAAPGSDPAAARAAVAAAAGSRLERTAAQLMQAAAAPRPAGSASSGQPSSSGPAPPASAPSPGSQQPQLNPNAVASSVRAKIQALQAAVAGKDSEVAALRLRVAAAQSQHEAALRAAEEGHKVRGLPAWGQRSMARQAGKRLSAGLPARGVLVAGPPALPSTPTHAGGAGGTKGRGRGRICALPGVHRPSDGRQGGAGG